MAADRNAPCPCGGGRKFKVCHGDSRRHGDWTSGRCSLVAIDDTTYSAEGWLGAPGGKRQLLTADSLTWTAVCVPASACEAFYLDLIATGAGLRSAFGLDELHWNLIFQGKVDLSEADRIRAFTTYARLLERHPVHLVVQTAYGAKATSLWEALDRADQEASAQPTRVAGTEEARQICDLLNEQLLQPDGQAATMSAESPRDLAMSALLGRLVVGFAVRGWTPAEVLIDQHGKGRRGADGVWNLRPDREPPFATLRDPIRCVDSSTSDAVQLADFCCYLVKRMQQMTHRGDLGRFEAAMLEATNLVGIAWERGLTLDDPADPSAQHHTVGWEQAEGGRFAMRWIEGQVR